jgi:hypothetical protein
MAKECRMDERKNALFRAQSVPNLVAGEVMGVVIRPDFESIVKWWLKDKKCQCINMHLGCTLVLIEVGALDRDVRDVVAMCKISQVLGVVEQGRRSEDTVPDSQWAQELDVRSVRPPALPWRTQVRPVASGSLPGD